MDNPFLPVPGPEDAEQLAAIACLLGIDRDWAPRLHDATDDNLDEARDLLDTIENIGVMNIEGRLYYGPPAQVTLVQLMVLIAWQGPMLAVLGGG